LKRTSIRGTPESRIVVPPVGPNSIRTPHALQFGPENSEACRFNGLHCVRPPHNGPIAADPNGGVREADEVPDPELNEESKDMNHDLEALTYKYVALFNDRDIAGVASLMTPDFMLTDPDVRRLAPREKVLQAVKAIFEAGENGFAFRARAVHLAGRFTILEFELDIGEDKMEGVDIIEWKDGEMVEMRAYVNPRP